MNAALRPRSLADSRRAAVDSPWLKPLPRRPGARVRLFCFPHAGGSAQAYRGFARHLPDDVEVCAVQPPGRDERADEPALRALAPLVSEAVGALLPAIDRPYLLFGHSMGAVVAFEAARALHAAGVPSPLALFVSGRRAPHLPGGDRGLHRLDDARFLDGLRRYEGTPETLLGDPAMAELFLPTIRADVCAVETYQYVAGPPLDCRLVACGGVQDADASRDDLAAWRTHTVGRFELAMFPGGHFYLRGREARLVQLLAEAASAGAGGSDVARAG